MDFNMSRTREILSRTPAVLRSMLVGLHDDWLDHNEGGETWSPFIITGHLVHAEKTNWIPRVKAILNEKGDKKFPPFDRMGQFEYSEGKSIQQLVNEFDRLRKESLAQLESFKITNEMLKMTGIHPEFGPVTLSQLLSTWTAHDLGHLTQITRVMARQYKEAIGPWVKYLSVMTR